MNIFYKNTPGYEQARVGRVFNQCRPERYPEAVFFPENADDVVEAVKFAKANGHKIAIRAGGHSWAAWSVRESGILLDLAHLNQIQFDTTTNIVQAQPAVKGGQELNPFLREHGRMFCGGHCPTVGIGGFLLQGGQGWNARGWGWAVEYIIAIDVVTADGELVRANETQNQDLFWAARGAGPGFFGVVVCFHLKTVPLPKALYASTFVYPVQEAEAILNWWQAIHSTVSLNVELVLLGQSIPNNELRMDYIPITTHHTSHINGTPSAHRPVIIVHALALEQTLEAALEALKPFETCPVIDKALVCRTNYETTFAEQLVLQTEANPENHRYLVNNAWLEGSPEEITARMLPAFTTLPTPQTFSLWYSMAPLRQLPDMAFSLQTEIYFATYVIYEAEADDEKNKAWLRQIIKGIEPITAGQYTGDSDFTAHGRKFISDQNYARLEQIRARRDPQGLFHSYLKNEDTVLNKNDFEK